MWTVAFSAAAQTTIYESATFSTSAGTGGQIVSEDFWPGVRFSTTESYRVTALGSHLATSGADRNIFVAVFPLEGVFPPSPPDVNDALFLQAFTMPGVSGDHAVPTDFVLPPGDWAIVFGSGHGVSTGQASVQSTNVDLVDTADYLYFNHGTWLDRGHGGARFFIEGFPPDPICGNGVLEGPEACDDGNVSNRDACLIGCIGAVCGDRHVQRDVEQCDDGNDNDADGCSNECLTGTTTRQLEPQADSGGCQVIRAAARPELPLWMGVATLVVLARLRTNLQRTR